MAHSDLDVTARPTALDIPLSALAFSSGGDSSGVITRRSLEYPPEVDITMQAV